MHHYKYVSGLNNHIRKACYYSETVTNFDGLKHVLLFLQKMINNPGNRHICFCALLANHDPSLKETDTHSADPRKIWHTSLTSFVATVWVVCGRANEELWIASTFLNVAFISEFITIFFARQRMLYPHWFNITLVTDGPLRHQQHSW